MKPTTALVACVLILCVAGLSYKALNTTDKTIATVMSWPGKIGAAVKDLFHTDTTINSTSVTLKQEQITELALIQRKTLCVTKFDTASVIHTHSTVIIRGEFTIKVGYDLNQGCKINFDESTKTVRLSLPPAKILSIETVKQGIYYYNEGIANSLDPEEMQEAYNANSSAARKEAEDLGVTHETEFLMQQRVKDIFRGLASEVIINDQPVNIPKL